MSRARAATSGQPRLSLGGLLVLVACLGLGMAAVRTPNSVLASVELTITLALAGLAILMIIYRVGERRAFWVGFLVFGGGYAGLAFGPWSQAEILPHLITTRAMAELYPKVHPPPQPTRARVLAPDMDLFSYAYRQYDAEVLWNRNLVNFLRIGHAMIAQGLGPAGGLLAVRLFRHRALDEAAPLPRETPR